MRLILSLAVLLGLLAPKMGAALAGLAPGVERVVICAGDGMRVIHLRGGVPVEVDLPELARCAPAAPPPPPAAAPDAWRALAAVFALALPPPPALPARATWRGPPPSHGPPLPA
ncbi:hypothetical protein BCF33_0368 [Hasllibacter halocynthiae]|uniref:Uncharacterized protein n=1 Tax=Hasllibacter halocynthiae TaxID=595589 RepID=A0A2T0X748_9RHOB|nr:hypothetical protein [Hasllibacter halocynthiae]PRY94770.1 hypothetical protein BCF33_0368 [Hasllibacter halocynthiae]